MHVAASSWTLVDLPFIKFSPTVNVAIRYFMRLSARTCFVPMCKHRRNLNVKKALLAITVSIALAGGIQAGDDHDGDHHHDHFEFQPGTLVLTRSVYVGTPSLLVPGVTVLPPGRVAGTPGSSVTVHPIAGGVT